MAEIVSVLDEEIDVSDAPPLRVVVTAQVAKSSNRIDVHYHFSNRDGARYCEVTYAASVTNPLIVSSILISAATAYGVCLGTRYLWGSYGIVRDTYKEVVETERNAVTPSQRAYHVVNKLPGEGKKFRELAMTIAKECGPSAAGGGIKEWLGF